MGERPYSALIVDKSLLRRVIVANALQWMQQFTGINAILGYGPTIFKAAGVPISGLQASFITNCFNLVFTGVMIAVIDKWGRRSLLLIGAIVMCIFMGVSGGLAHHIEQLEDDDPMKVNAGWALLGCMCIYMAFFAVGWGGTAWVYPSEIFPMDIKEKALSTSVGSQWIANFAIAYMIPKQVSSMGIPGTLFFYTGCLAAVSLISYVLVPETKGLALEDMDALFGGATRKEIQDIKMNAAKEYGACAPFAQSDSVKDVMNLEGGGTRQRRSVVRGSKISNQSTSSRIIVGPMGAATIL